MKRSYVLLVAFCGVMAFLLSPGIASADGPTTPNGWIPPLDNTITVPNTGGSAGPEWGAYTRVDKHGSASPFMGAPHYDGYGWVDDGVVVLWSGASLPTTLPGSLDELLRSPDGSKVNDLLVFYGGISKVYVVSNPVTSLLPFETEIEDPNNRTFHNQLWSDVSTRYALNAKVISANLPQVYTVYQPPNENWPGWDPSVQDWQYYAGTDPQGNPRYNTDYPPPSTWTQYIFNVANDNMQVPEPGALLLLGFGFMALAGIRRVVKARA